MQKTLRKITRNFAVFLLLICVSYQAAFGATLLGIYYGNQGWKMEQVQAMESWQGKGHAVVNMFTNWCNQTKIMNNLFSQQLPNIWNNKNVPMVTWEPFLCNAASTPADVEVRAGNGEYDAYLNSWATRLKTFLSGADGTFGTADDRRVYIRLGHEMNGDWYPWGAVMGGNSPADYARMWQRVVGIFRAKGMTATHVQWVWTANNDDVGAFAAEQFYPGDSYVDWVAIDGYNWGESQTWSNWETPDEVYGNMTGRLRALTSKPLALTETGSTTSTLSGVSVAAKLQWTTDFFNYLAARDVRLVAWFNEDKETDWAIFGGGGGDGTFTLSRTNYKTYSTYRTGVGSANVVGANAANPRLLTDAQFAGQ
jgi:mannan endo-1,4-beta-mannosidase